MTDSYPDDRAYLRDELARLDCRLRLEVNRFEGPIDEFGALYISEAEVKTLLARETTDDADRLESDEHQQLARHTREIRAHRQATADSGAPVRLDRLLDHFSLPPLVREVLLVALAPDLDEKYATVYAYLQDDATRRRPTVGFILGLLDPEANHLDDRWLFTAGSPLVDADLLTIAGDGPLPTRDVSVDPQITAYLLGDPADDPVLSPHTTVRTPTAGLDSLDLPPTRRRSLAGVADPVGEPAPPLVALHGPPGTGKNARIEAVCADRNTGLLTLDTTRVDPDSWPRLLDRVARESRLRQLAVLLDGILDDEAATIHAIDRLDDLQSAVFLTGETAPSNAIRTAPSHHDFVALSVDRVDYEARRHYWVAREDLPPDADPATLASTFRLSRGAIDDAMQMATASARARGDTPSADDIYDACRQQSSEELTEFATRIDPTYDWSDIVLPADTERQLREVAARLQNRGTVYADWGFAAQTSLGNGLIALFSGPSGTGKTMAAEVVANHAGLHLYKIDLASVVSKYIGETEKNLGRIFDEAADSNAILLFDEADALFGERSEVSDAHDRYANVEVDYLLQRVEEHDGAVLLTTNLESNIDDAFMRRIHLGVDFPMPDRSARAEIWRRVFPEDTPVADLDYDFLGRLDLTGGNVRNVALSAAFLAASEDKPVTMAAIVRAVKREYQKNGMPIQPDEFGEYSDLIDHS